MLLDKLALNDSFAVPKAPPVWDNLALSIVPSVNKLFELTAEEYNIC